MAVRVTVAALLSAVLMFLWGFVFWSVIGAATMIQTPLPVDRELDVTAALRNAQLETGMYLYPFPAPMGDEEAGAELERKAAEGPRLQMAYVKEGGAVMEPVILIKGFVHMLVVALLAAALTASVAGSLPNFGRRFAFVLLTAVIAAAWANAGDAIWWMHPPAYAAGTAVFQIGAGLLMAAVIAAIVRRTDAEAIA